MYVRITDASAQNIMTSIYYKNLIKFKFFFELKFFSIKYFLIFFLISDLLRMLETHKNAIYS